MLRHVQAASRFSKIFYCSSGHLRHVLRAGKGKESLPREILEKTLTDWGAEAMEILNVKVEVTGKPSTKPSLFLGNHISYLDIPLLSSQVPLMFVAKKEVGAWPIFGTAVRKFGMVLVDRDAADSRAKAAEAVAQTILTRRQSVAIFPSGTTRIDEDTPWRWGAFVIAKRYGIPVQPFRLWWEPVRAAAYLKEDVFATHLWSLLANRQKLTAKVEFHEPIEITDPEADCRRWWEWSRTH